MPRASSASISRLGTPRSENFTVIRYFLLEGARLCPSADRGQPAGRPSTSPTVPALPRFALHSLALRQKPRAIVWIDRFPRVPKRPPSRRLVGLTAHWLVALGRG